MTTRIHLTAGYRGKDMGDVYYPPGEYDFPEPIASRLIRSGQALRVSVRGKLQDFVGTPQNVAVTVEQVLAAVTDMTDEEIISLAGANEITIPAATTRAAAIAALVEAALRPDAVLSLNQTRAKAPVMHTRLARDEQEREIMLNEQGRTMHAPQVAAHDDPVPPAPGTAAAEKSAERHALEAQLALQGVLGSADLTQREYTKDILVGYGSRLGVPLEMSMTKAEMIAALRAT